MPISLERVQACSVHVSANDARHKRRPKQLLKAIKKQQHDRRIRRFLQERRWPFF